MRGACLRCAAVLLFCAGLAGCGGGGSHAIPSAAGTSGTTTAGTNAATTASFTITVPPRSAQAKSRNPQYISTATESVIITLTSVNGAPPSGPLTAAEENLTPSNAACSAGPPLTCTITVAAAPGTDVFTVDTYDQQQTGSSTTPVGALLSTGTISVNVVGGQTNALPTPLVLNGVVATITASFQSDPHISGTQTSGYAIVGSQPYTLTISAQDASGATIVGPGAPTFTVSSASSAVAVSPAVANTFAVQVKSYSASPVMLSANATSGNLLGFTIATVQEMWFTAYDNGTIAGYAIGAGAPTAIGSDEVSGLTHPWGLVYDANGLLWVADLGSNFAAAYDGPTEIAADRFSSLADGPWGIAFDSSGLLWIAECGNMCTGSGGNGLVLAYAAGFSLAKTISSGIATPISVVFDSSGNVWVANFLGDDITAYSPSGSTPAQIPADTISSGISHPTALAFDSAGHLWISNCGAACSGGSGPTNVQEWDVSGPSPVFVTSISGIVQPENLAFDASGNLWVADHLGNAIRAYSGTTAIGGDTITFTSGRPAGIAITP